ncbi:MAG: metal-dependent hydrolase [Saprospiraceae bacterium]|nr:metal-dependent hydrolase [Saprospiraceae bacterium]
MDSLTQIVLGAAVGEAVLGKKAGNRAILWGAVAGTIPDLDVAANAVFSPIDALAFHRGPTHSVVFCIAGAIAFGWILHRMYRYRHHRYIAALCWGFMVLSIAGAIILTDAITIIKTIAGLSLAGLGVYTIYYRYTRDNYRIPDDITVREWQWLFFWSLITHPILDCFTTYGTQMLLPFSDYRIGFNNISVVDPLYTVPFMLFLTASMFFRRTDKRRRILNGLGLVVSSIYMIWTFTNKARVNEVFEQSLQADGISYQRYMTTPTILNNILWYGVAESDTAWHFGQYSFFDSDKKFRLQTIPKNKALSRQFDGDYTFEKLKWFSNRYYNITEPDSGRIVFEDLRFGTFRTSAEAEDKFVFRFYLEVNADGSLKLLNRGDGPRDGNFREMFSLLWNRILGRIT